MDTKKIEFWDEQAGKGELSGTRDRYAKELEMRAIARHVKDGMRVLDVGCGDGETLMWLRDNLAIEGVGLDYSEKMIKKARSYDVDNLRFHEFDIKALRNLKNYEPFDLIYTQRALINLDTWKEQRQAILDIISLLKPGGTYVMVECFQEGLQEINELRLKVGLETIVPPWHNRYLRIGKGELHTLFKELIRDDVTHWPDIEYFSGAYYFMSRVVNAYLAHWSGGEPSYDSTVNLLGTLLPPGSVNLRGQTQAWIIKKKEGV